jgi:ribonuclease-3 family protein
LEKVKFKQLQAVKSRAYAAFARGEHLEVPEEEAARLDSISLAFVGDAYYALHLRHRLVDTGIPHVQILHLLAAEFVSAKVQAYVYRQIKNDLQEEEKMVCQRARNAHTQVPKSASVSEYHDSTALEALVGYLVMAEKTERLGELMEQVYTYTKEYCAVKHGEKDNL